MQKYGIIINEVFIGTEGEFMDLQALVDSFEPMTCIMSVEVFPDGSYGNIRIVVGNKAYVNSIENPDVICFSEMLDNKFVPDSPYERYIPKDLNFENACYNSAVLKKSFHTYIHPERYSFWVDMYMMPLASDKENIYYCTYSQELTPEANTKRMSNVDATVSVSVLETCIKLRGTADFKHTIDDVISDIREMCGAQVCCILLTDFKERKCSVLCDSSAPGLGLLPVSEYLNAHYTNFFDIVATWKDTIAGSTCLIIQNESDMEVLRERNPVWCESMQASGIQSIVLYPLLYNDETLGYIWAINFDTENTVRIRATLEITSYFVASEIANYQLLEQLETMSTVDMLTDVYNRNAMNKRIDELMQDSGSKPDSLAVVFADLNGLKQVNDNDGHVAGDMLLKDAAGIFKKVFFDGEIYRAGGDEFMAIVTDISEEELEKRIEKLKKYSETDGNVSFSLGYCYDASDCNIRKAMSIADKSMYKNKQQFYENHPDRRRQN